MLRSGSTGMDAGRAVLGHGWPVTAGPRSGAGTREPERSEGRTPGQGLFGSFCGCLTKGTRRKGETIVSVNRECWICTPCDSCFAMRPHLCRVHIHSICHDFLGFRPYGVSLFPNAEIVTKKACPTLRPPRPGSVVPSLRHCHGHSRRLDIRVAPAKAKCIAGVTEPYEKRFSANIQAAEEPSEAAVGCAAATLPPPCQEDQKEER